MKKILIAALSLAAQLSPAYAQTIPLMKYGGTLKKMDVLVGGATAQFLFDTGGAETFLTPDTAARACRKIYGKGVGYRMHGEAAAYQKCDGAEIKAGGIQLPLPTVVVLDIMSYLPPAAPKIDGMLSLQSFQNKIISMDLPAGMLTIETPKSAKKKKKRMTRLESRFPTGMSGSELDVLVGVKRNGAMYWFLFDTGNGHHPYISPQTAFDWGLQQDPVSTGTTHRTEISLGTRTETIDFDTEDIIYDGVLNYAVIAKKAYLIDLINKEIWTD